MKYIRNISDEQNKAGDTDNVFRLNLFEDDKLFDFGTNGLTVNVANSSGYILSLTPKKETGNTVIDLDFNDAPLKSLTPDDYLLEVEVKFSDGTTATFPTKGGMPFTVNGNLKETSGTLVPTVTFDNVLDAVDKKIAVYMDTVKVGPIGPQGLPGNVDTSHDNTFTGVNKFIQLIDGALKTRAATFKDFAQVAKDMTGYAGLWFVDNKRITGAPSGSSNSYVVEVIPGSWSGNGIILISSIVSEEFYVSRVDSSLQKWVKLSDDATVVHNTGTETVAGDKTFTGIGTFTGPTTLKTGNYGLRVTTTGVQKTSDNGVTWTNI